MIPQILASAIIQFCALTSTDDLSSQTKGACVDYMINCSVDQKGSIPEENVSKCESLWMHNREKLTEETNKKREE